MWCGEEISQFEPSTPLKVSDAVLDRLKSEGTSSVLPSLKVELRPSAEVTRTQACTHDEESPKAFYMTGTGNSGKRQEMNEVAISALLEYSQGGQRLRVMETISQNLDWTPQYESPVSETDGPQGHRFTSPAAMLATEPMGPALHMLVMTDSPD